MTSKIIYLDNNATTAVDKEVLESMAPYFCEMYGNAASILHAYGWQAEAAVDIATQQIAGLINAHPDEIFYTSGATESVNLAMKGIFLKTRKTKQHIVTVSTEHKAVLDVCVYLEEHVGAEVTYLRVNREGEIDLEELKNAIKPNTVLVSIMAANNETGVLHPIEHIVEICKQNKVLFFCDATQFVGKMRCDVAEWGIDLMAFSPHKFHGPKGIGALYINKNSEALNLEAQIHGGGHQRGFRSGTLNVPAIVGFGKACEIAGRDYWEINSHVSKLKNHFEHQLLEINQLYINGSTRNRLYNTSSIQFPEYPELKKWTAKMAFSSGSACTSASAGNSHVLQAMGLNSKEIKKSFRFSFSKFNTLEEVNSVISLIENKTN